MYEIIASQGKSLTKAIIHSFSVGRQYRTDYYAGNAGDAE